MREKKEVTRAELVRLRRDKENSRRRERAKKEATRPVPTVTPRAPKSSGFVATQSQPKRRSTRADNARSSRRRFQLALLPVTPDTNLRGFSLPRPRLRLGPRLFSFFVVALLGAALYCAFELPEFRTGEAHVAGNQILSSAEISTAMNVTGQPVFLLVPSELETRLRLNYPELSSVHVSVALPNVLSVQVAERRPVIRWEQGSGYTWVAEDGVAFRPRGELTGLISVNALSAPPAAENASSDPLTPAPFISPEMVRAVEGLAAHVPPGMTILYDSSFGFGWNDPRGWRVYFGTKASDVELKMRVYEAMVSSLTQRGIRPAVINVTYPTAPYYRMSQ